MKKVTLAATGSSAMNWLMPGCVVDYLRVLFPGLAFNFADAFALRGLALACSVAVSGPRLTRAGVI